MAREPEERRVASDACITLEGVRYQLTEDMAGEQVTVLFGLFDNELYVEFQGQKQGPFYPAAGPIPLHTYRTFKKSKTEKHIDKLEALARKLSLPRSVLAGQTSNDLKLIQQANLVNEDKSQSFIPFEGDTSENHTFKSVLEAKLAIAKNLGKPLALLSESQRQHIDNLIAETLHKVTLLVKVQEYFKLKLVANEA